MFLDPRSTVSVLSPLLQEPSENTHATLITSCVTAVEHYTKSDFALTHAAFKAMSQYQIIKELLIGNPLIDFRTQAVAAMLGRDVEKSFSL